MCLGVVERNVQEAFWVQKLSTTHFQILHKGMLQVP